MDKLKIYQLLNLIDKATLYIEAKPEKVKILSSYPEPHEVPDSPRVIAEKQIGVVTCLPTSLFNEIVNLAVDLNEEF